MEEELPIDRFLWSESKKLTFEELLDRDYPGFQDEVKKIIVEYERHGHLSDEFLAQLRREYDERVAIQQGRDNFYEETHTLNDPRWGFIDDSINGYESDRDIPQQQQCLPEDQRREQ